MQIISNRMITEERRKIIAGEKIDVVYITVLFVVAIMTLITFWFVDIGRGKVQIVIDFCIIITLVFL